MTTQSYCLTFVLPLAGSDLGTMQQSVAITADSTDEAVKLAQFYCAELPSGALVSATLQDAAGAVLWLEQNGHAPDVLPAGRDQP